MSFWQLLKATLFHEASPPHPTPPCVLKSHRLWLLQMSFCGCGGYWGEKKGVWVVSEVLSYKIISSPFTAWPPPFAFHPSARLNICLSIHGCICIPLKWFPGGVVRWGEERVQSPCSGSEFSTSLHGNNAQHTECWKSSTVYNYIIQLQNFGVRFLSRNRITVNSFCNWLDTCVYNMCSHLQSTEMIAYRSIKLSVPSYTCQGPSCLI